MAGPIRASGVSMDWGALLDIPQRPVPLPMVEQGRRTVTQVAF
jgi:hypothetical protein